MAKFPFNDCPPWLILSILDQIEPKERIAPLACLSRTWQTFVEARTFRSIHLASTDLQAFRDIVASVESRQAALETLAYHVVLPKSDEDPSDKGMDVDGNGGAGENADVPKSYEADCCAFTHAVFDIFATLGPWPVLRGRSLLLRLCIGEVSDWASVCQRYRFAYLDLTSDAPLRSVPRLDRLVFGAPMHSAVIPRIISACPNLEMFTHGDHEYYPARQALRRSRRHEFARALAATTPPPTLKRLYMIFEYQCPADHSFQVENVAWNDGGDHHPMLGTKGHDEWSSAWRDFTLRVPSLETLTLIGAFGVSASPALFWPADGAAPDMQWPAMRAFHVYVSPVAPDGSWYFSGDRDGGDDDASRHAVPLDLDFDSTDGDDFDARVYSSRGSQDEDIAAGGRPINPWRKWPCMRRILPLFTAAARAAGRMPALQQMTVSLRHPDYVPCMMSFARAGHRLDMDELELNDWTFRGPEVEDVQNTPRVALFLPEGVRVEDGLDKVWRESVGWDTEFQVVSMVQESSTK